jgi:hypothetical protein
MVSATAVGSPAIYNKHVDVKFLVAMPTAFAV